MLRTPIHYLGVFKENCLWIKREDLIPFSFGGNKARKAILFFEEIDKGDYNCVVTYGSSSSNHCRIVANQCCRRGIKCYVISPLEESKPTFNSEMLKIFGTEITVVPVSRVHETIENKINELSVNGLKPYFIEGGGHGNIGTQAYVDCYKEIIMQEDELGISFDYIFFASGTGTTQAGLVCGQLIAGDDRKIVGISIARKNPRGREVVLNSVRSYLGTNFSEDQIQNSTIFIDDYTSGYGKDSNNVKNTIKDCMRSFGIPMDITYTGKAFMGMTHYIESVKNKNILFIHTGGTPLFFDGLRGDII